MNLRRTIATLLAALMLLALNACGAGTTSPAQDANDPAEETAPSTTESSQLRVGMECAYAPSNWQESAATDTNVPVENVVGACAEGYDVQIARILANQLGKELVIVKLSWDGLIDALNQGQIDAIIAGHEGHRRAPRVHQLLRPVQGDDLQHDGARRLAV